MEIEIYTHTWKYKCMYMIVSLEMNFYSSINTLLKEYKPREETISNVPACGWKLIWVPNFIFILFIFLNIDETHVCLLYDNKISCIFWFGHKSISFEGNYVMNDIKSLIKGTICPTREHWKQWTSMSMK